MRLLKQSTSVDLPIGPFLDATDGVTAETALTLTQPDIRLKKNGGAWAQKAAAQTLSHEENGYYEVTLDATDTDTLGQLRLAVAESGALPVWEEFMVMPANVWDSLFGADKLQVDVAEWLGTAPATPTVAGVPEVDLTHVGGDAQSATDLKDFADAGYDPATNKVEGVKLADSLTAVAAGGITAASVATDAIDADALATDAVAEITSGLATGADLATLTGYVDTEVAAIKAKTDNLPASPAATGDIPTAASIADAVWDEATSGHTTSGTYGQRLQALRAGTAQAGANGSVTLDASASAVDDFYKNALIVITAGTGVGQARTISGYTGATKVATITPNWGTNPSSDSVFVLLPAGAIAGASAPTAGEVADAVWDEARSGHVSAGSFGEGVVVNSLAAGAITAAAIATGAVDADALAADAVTELQSGLSTLDAAGVRTAVGLASANLDTQLAAIDDYLDTEVAAIKAKTDNLPASPAATGDIPAAASIADAVWDEATTGHTTAGTFGEQLKTDVDAILADTGTDGVALADGVITAAKIATGAIDADALATDAVSEIVDAVWAKTMTELTSVPGVTGTTLAALSWVFTLARNKRTQTSSTETVYKDDGSTSLATSTKSDDGTTFSRGEYS